MSLHSKITQIIIFQSESIGKSQNQDILESFFWELTHHYRQVGCVFVRFIRNISEISRRVSENTNRDVSGSQNKKVKFLSPLREKCFSGTCVTHE